MATKETKTTKKPTKENKSVKIDKLTSEQLVVVLCNYYKAFNFNRLFEEFEAILKHEFAGHTREDFDFVLDVIRRHILMRDPKTFIPLNEELNNMIEKFRKENDDIITNAHLDQLEFKAMLSSKQGYFDIPQDQLLRETALEYL
jgi:hypothetical protein